METKSLMVHFSAQAKTKMSYGKVPHGWELDEVTGARASPGVEVLGKTDGV